MERFEASDAAVILFFKEILGKIFLNSPSWGVSILFLFNNKNSLLCLFLKTESASPSSVTYFIFSNAKHVISSIFLFKPAPGPIKKLLILNFLKIFINCSKDSQLIFKDEGKIICASFIIFLLPKIVTDPVPTLSADIADNIDAPAVSSSPLNIYNLPLVYLWELFNFLGNFFNHKLGQFS